MIMYLQPQRCENCNELAEVYWEDLRGKDILCDECQYKMLEHVNINFFN